MQNKLLYPLFMFLMCVSFQGRGEVYKWVDERGQTHYGEKPPGSGATEVEIRDAPKVDPAVRLQNEEREKLLKIYEEERGIRNEEKKKAEEEQRKREEQCHIVRNELEDMKQRGVVYYDIDDKGERRYLSEAELAARVRKLEEQYNKYCK